MDNPYIKQTVCKVLNIFQYGKYLVAYVLKATVATTQKKKIGLQDRLLFNAGQSIAECSKRAFCYTFDLH